MIVKMTSRQLPARGTLDPVAYSGLATEDTDAVEPWTLKKQCLVTLLVLVLLFFIKPIQIYKMTVTPPDQLMDAATVLFPHLSESPPRTLQSPYFYWPTA